MRHSLGRSSGTAILLGAAIWSVFTWPLPRHAGNAIPWTGHTADRPAVRELVPGDHLQLLYHFWLARDMLAGNTPFFANQYEFNTGEDRDRREPGTYYAPFSLLYAAVAAVGGDAFGWNATGLAAVLLGTVALHALARRHGASPRTALAATAISAATPYAWTTLLGGSPTGFGMSLVPLLAWGLDLAVRDRRAWGGALAGAALLAAAGADLHTLYFGALLAPFWILFAACCDPAAGRSPAAQALRGVLRALWPLAALGAVVALLAWQVDRQLLGSEVATGRTWDEVRLFSPAGKGFLWAQAPGMSRHLYLGFALCALLATSLAAWFAETRRGLRVSVDAATRRDTPLRERSEELSASQSSALPAPVGRSSFGRGELCESGNWRGVTSGSLPVALLLLAFGGILALAWGANGPFDGLAMKAARRLLPRYEMIRQSVKVYCLLPTVMVVLLARTLPALARRTNGRVVTAGLVALTLYDLHRPFAPGLCRLPDRLPVYEAVVRDAAARAVAAHRVDVRGKDAHVVALPLWPGDSHESSRYEFAVLRSRVRFVNGYAPVVPANYRTQVFEPLAALNQGELYAQHIARLRQLRVGYVVVHSDAFSEAVGPLSAAAVLRRLFASPWLEPIGNDGRQWAFALRDVPRPPAAHVAFPWPTAWRSADTDTLRVPTAECHHVGGRIDPGDGSLTLTPELCAAGLAAWMLTPVVEAGPVAISLVFLSPAPRGTRLGDLVVRTPAGDPLGDAPLIAGQPCELTAAAPHREPLRLEIHYHRTGDLRALQFEVSAVPAAPRGGH